MAFKIPSLEEMEHINTTRVTIALNLMNMQQIFHRKLVK